MTVDQQITSAGKILLVDDDEDFLWATDTMLQKAGYSVIQAKDGEEVLRLLEKDIPDLILMDYRLPNRNGLEVAADVKQRIPTVPIIMLTGYAEVEAAVNAMRMGVYDYVTKPIDIDDLLFTIKRCLEKQRAEEALKASAREWQTTFDAMSDWISLIDLEKRIQRTNSVGEQFGGIPTAQLLGQNCCKLVHGSEGPLPGCPFEKMLHTRQRETIELQSPDGDRWLTITVDPVIDDHGNLLGAVHIVRDITEQKKMEEELLKAKKLESIGILAGGFAHDYNNLLTAIIGNMSLAKLYLKPDDKAFKPLKEMETAAIRAAELTKKIITFAKGGEPVKKAASISQLLKSRVEHALSGSDIKCELAIPDDLWPIQIDEYQIGEVINNLVINAAEAMPRGGTIKATAENVRIAEENTLWLKKGKYLKISIEDEGAGIPDEVLEKIFDPYFSTKEMGTKKGMGLGLSICHSIIKRHGGHIGVESRVGVGTTFYFYLPAIVPSYETQARRAGLPAD